MYASEASVRKQKRDRNNFDLVFGVYRNVFKTLLYYAASGRRDSPCVCRLPECCERRTYHRNGKLHTSLLRNFYRGFLFRSSAAQLYAVDIHLQINTSVVVGSLQITNNADALSLE